MRVADHVVQARRERLALLLKQHQYLPIAEVCARLGVSEPTARRDLAALAKEHTITRTRGGALVEYNQKFPSFRDRLTQGTGGKRAIADAAYRLLRPGQTVWLDGGTTLYAVAERIAARPLDGLTVVTNNMPAAELLADIDALAVHLLGGQYFRRSSLLLGGKSLEAAKLWSFDVALLGAEGITGEGFWNSLADVVTLQRLIVAGARRNVVCLDATKVGRSGPELLLGVDGVHAVLSDAPASLFRDAGVRLGAGQLIRATVNETKGKKASS